MPTREFLKVTGAKGVQYGDAKKNRRNELDAGGCHAAIFPEADEPWQGKTEKDPFWIARSLPEYKLAPQLQKGG